MENIEPVTESADFKTVEVFPSKFKPLLLVLGAILLFLLGTFSIIRGVGDDVSGWILIIFSSFCGFLLIGALIFKIPRIVLNSSGIHYVSVYRQKLSWDWSAVGPFSVSHQSFRYTTIAYVCAFSDIANDLLQVHGHRKKPDYMNADIVINLNLLPPNKNSDAAMEFAKLLNKWRDEFGSPEMDVVADETKIHADLLVQKINSKNKKFTITIALSVIAAILIELLLEIYYW